MSDKPKVLRIVPGERDSTGAQLANGTRIFCGDQEVSNVTKLTLVAEVGGVWKASIECSVKPPSRLYALLESESDAVEVTNLSDDAKRFIMAAAAGIKPNINLQIAEAARCCCDGQCRKDL
ncbi:hypothetical protein [uncultured Delftia sp.]|jgi:hypothetical protein|uniref:hypothetical protein n=1 Tax=uncultured Delftia sp. TaxID=191464 RepID=UPI002595D700|nr:hypothetical protein [uncultured Delftia sp.]